MKERNKLICFFFALICASTAQPHTSFAGDATPEHDTYLSLSIENDMLGGGTDQYYTSGVRATWFNDKISVPRAMKEISDHIPSFDIDQRTGVYYTLGHNLYTPQDITVPTLQADDRPWAAFLYGSVGLVNITENENAPDYVDDLELTLGVVGPEALGKPIQRFVHSHISTSSDTPRGWENQLNFEPGVMLSWQRRVPEFISYEFGGLYSRIEPNFNMTLGNIRTHIGVGAMAMIGSEQEQDTPPRVRPAIPGTGIFSHSDNIVDWQLFAGFDTRLVGRDIFLDGNTFSDSHSVDKRYLVADLSAGAALSMGDYRLSYTLNWRSKEFRTQDDNSVFGSLTLTKRF